MLHHLVDLVIQRQVRNADLRAHIQGAGAVFFQHGGAKSLQRPPCP
mgnify:CR=1 FL=1